MKPRGETTLPANSRREHKADARNAPAAMEATVASCMPRCRGTLVILTPGASTRIWESSFAKVGISAFLARKAGASPPYAGEIFAAGILCNKVPVKLK